MLLNPPTPAIEAVRIQAAPAVLASTPELGIFSQAFLAGRKRVLGTVSLSLFRTMVRAASGWLSARPSDFSIAPRAAAFGTARRHAQEPDGRVASGWLPARRPEDFLAGREKALGTALSFAIQSPAARTASGWLSVRRPDEFSEADGGGYHVPVFPV